MCCFSSTHLSINCSRWQHKVCKQICWKTPFWVAIIRIWDWSWRVPYFLQLSSIKSFSVFMEWFLETTFFSLSESPWEWACSNNDGITIPWLKKIIWVVGVLRRTLVCDWRFDNLCGSHLQSQVIVLVSWKFKNPGERFDWSIDRVADGKRVMWLTMKTCAEIGYANRWVSKWIINNVLLFPVE